MRWRLRWGEFTYEVPYRPELVWQVSHASSKLLYPLDTNVSEATEDKILTFEFGHAASKQWLKEKGLEGIFFPDYVLGTITVFTQSHTVSHISSDENWDNTFDATDYINEANETHVHDGLAVILSTFELFE